MGGEAPRREPYSSIRNKLRRRRRDLHSTVKYAEAGGARGRDEEGDDDGYDDGGEEDHERNTRERVRVVAHGGGGL